MDKYSYTDNEKVTRWFDITKFLKHLDGTRPHLSWIQIQNDYERCFKDFVISNQQVIFSLSVYDYLSIMAREI